MLLSARDLLGLTLSFVFAFGMIAAAEVGRRLWKLPRLTTRKAIHIAAGMWVFGIIAIFDHWWAGIIPPAAFIILNYIFYRYSVFKAMDSAEGPGTVVFAFSVTMLLAVFWSQGQPQIAAAGLMPMVWGDALAALVGSRFGGHQYVIAGVHRSWEGSAAMFAASLLSTWLALAYFRLAETSLTSSLVLAWTATFAEAFSPKGWDNLTVPFISCGLLYLFLSRP